MSPDEFSGPSCDGARDQARERARRRGPATRKWAEVSRTVDAALELPPEQRAAYIAQACAGDGELRARVEQLLRACERAEHSESFLAEPAGAYAAPVVADFEARAAASVAELPARLAAALAGRYALAGEIGRGGMATVFLARDLQQRRLVAVKVLRPALAMALGPERFLREIEVAAGLAHPHIVPLYESGSDDHLLYYVMPYVEGESLRERLQREGQLSLDDALEIARDVAGALDHAHRQGVVHRDIKPENILLEGGRAIVADFGLARAITAAGGERLTETGVAVGTPAYMSPEQATAESNIDGRTDVYSLACVVYETLAGEPPFTGPTAQVVIAKRLVTPPPRLSVVREAVPAAVDQAITRALARAPADRFPTASEFVAAMQGAAPGTPTSAEPTARTKRWWR